MAVTQIDGGKQIRNGTIVDAQIASGAAIATSKLADGAEFIKRGGTVAFTADQSHGGFKITSLADPTSAQDAATKAYVDAAAAGIDWKGSVKAASTANAAFATAFANGQVLDGVTLATGNRILIKDQTNQSDNGIYTVNASGAPTRATDADTIAEFNESAAVFVEQGTVNADTGWVETAVLSTLGSDSVVFTQFTGLGMVTAGAGLTKTGSVINVIAGDDSILVNADELHVQLKDASLETVSGGLRVKLASSAGDVYIGTTTTKVATPTTLSGDVSSITGAGVVTLGSTIQRTAGIITRETPTPAVDGATTVFSLANTPTAGSEHVFLNGILQEPGAGNDYTISGATITYLTAPLATDRLRVSYRK